MSKVWVVIFADAVRDKLFNAAKEGRFSVANNYQFQLQGLIDKMKSTVEAHGGSMPFCSPDIIASELPIDVAAELPNLVEGFAEQAGEGLAIGIGMDYQEAAYAAKQSYQTGKIELFNPADTYQEKISKTHDSRLEINRNVSLPTNLFDPELPDDKPYQKVIDQQSNPVPKRMSLKESLSAEAQFIQAINEMLGSGEIEQAAQQQQQMAQQQQAQQQQQPQGEDDQDAHANTNTVDLLGQLSGQPQQQPTDGQDQGQENGGDAKEATQEVTEKVDDATKEAAADHNQELMDKLKDVKSQIPQIMAMASKDPKAFQQTMSMIQKLITSAKQVQKAEQQLEKAVTHSGPEAMSGIRFPVGTRKGNYKKVLVNGKEVWRSMASGQVMAQDGTDISVKTNNQQQKAKQQ